MLGTGSLTQKSITADLGTLGNSDERPKTPSPSSLLHRLSSSSTHCLLDRSPHPPFSHVHPSFSCSPLLSWVRGLGRARVCRLYCDTSLPAAYLLHSTHPGHLPGLSALINDGLEVELKAISRVLSDPPTIWQQLSTKCFMRQLTCTPMISRAWDSTHCSQGTTSKPSSSLSLS